MVSASKQRGSCLVCYVGRTAVCCGLAHSITMKLRWPTAWLENGRLRGKSMWDAEHSCEMVISVCRGAQAVGHLNLEWNDMTGGSCMQGHQPALPHRNGCKRGCGLWRCQLGTTRAQARRGTLPLPGNNKSPWDRKGMMITSANLAAWRRRVWISTEAA